MSQKFVEKALDRGDECYCALKNDDLVGYSWCTSLSTRVCGRVFIKFPYSASYRYKSFVLPEHRGQKVLNGIHRLSEKSFIELGKSKCVSYIECHNYASFKSSDRAGNETIGYAAFLNRDKLFFSWHSRGAKKNGIYFYLDKNDSI